MVPQVHEQLTYKNALSEKNVFSDTRSALSVGLLSPHERAKILLSAFDSLIPAVH
jgi:hypothetical protein